jgi:hypothetical protein
MPATIKVGLTEVGNQEKSMKYDEISFICYQFRAEGPTYSHLPQYKADNYEAGIVMWAQKCQVSAHDCCCLDTCNKIFFRIN